MSLAGLLCAVITGPCGWVEIVDLFAGCIFQCSEPGFVEFQTFLFFVEGVLVFVDFNALATTITQSPEKNK